MKEKVLHPVLFIVIMFTIILSLMQYTSGLFWPVIHQEVKKSYHTDKTEVKTVVYYGLNVVWSEHIPLSDSAAYYSKQRAKEIIKQIKKSGL